MHGEGEKKVELNKDQLPGRQRKKLRFRARSCQNNNHLFSFEKRKKTQRVKFYNVVREKCEKYRLINLRICILFHIFPQKIPPFESIIQRALIFSPEEGRFTHSACVLGWREIYVDLPLARSNLDNEWTLGRRKLDELNHLFSGGYFRRRERTGPWENRAAK